MGDQPEAIYVISDLHIGGDEQKEQVDYLPELMDFLGDLEGTDEDAELVINGDAFGLWAFTDVDGPEKLNLLLEDYPDLFEQLRRTGENIDITLLPGNHDHELAAYPELWKRLREYNVETELSVSMSRYVGGCEVWFEHGHQQDPNNRIEDFGNPHSKPFGYYLNTRITGAAIKASSRGKYDWLKDMQAVTPKKLLPLWISSKYFYREMNPALRYVAILFLLLFQVSVLIAALAALDLMGVWSFPAEFIESFLGGLGQVGDTVLFLLTINTAVAGLMVLIAIPMYLLLGDVKKTLDRFGVLETNIQVDQEQPYVAAASKVFDEREDAFVFCYGHTHIPKLKEVSGGLLVNSGTWLKRLHRRGVVAGVLPPVFYPTYQLSVVRIKHESGIVKVDFMEIEKSNPTIEELTLTERVLTLGREPVTELPSGAVIEEDGDIRLE